MDREVEDMLLVAEELLFKAAYFSEGALEQEIHAIADKIDSLVVSQQNSAPVPK